MRIVWLVLMLLAAASPAGAGVAARATAGAPMVTDPALTAPGASIDQAQDRLHILAGALRTPALGDGQIKARIADIGPVQARLTTALAVLAPRLADTDARLAQLGAAPAAGAAPEAPETAVNRKTLTRARLAVDTEIKQARLLQVEAEQIHKSLTERLRRNFSARLWTQNRSVADPFLWRDFAYALPGDLDRLGEVVADQGQQFAQAGRKPVNPWIWAAAALIALLLIGPLRSLARSLVFRRAARVSPPTRLARSALAVGLVTVAAVAPLIAGLTLHAALVGVGAVTPVFDQLAFLTLRAVVFAALVEGLGRAILSPGRPQWRQAPILGEAVGRLAPYPALIGVAAALATLLAGFNTALGASQPASIAGECLTVLIEVAAVGGALLSMGRARGEHMAAAEKTESRLPWVIAALAAWLAVLGAVGALLMGYLALAAFLMRETIWIAVVLGALFLLLRLVDDLFPALLSPRRPLGRLFRTGVGVSSRALEQVGVLLSGVVRLGLLLFGWAAILAPFGAGAEDIVGRVTSSQMIFHLGQVSISPGAVLGGVALFLVGLIVTRAIRGWLEVRYLPKTRLDVGLRTSVAAGVTYLGVFIAILMTFAYIGLSLSQIALFASALSVGIGFGLQSIIGNFVSGLILLAERPVKVGDWIAIGEFEGDVKKINMRATEIEMMDRSKLIVPNSDLIAKTVRNITHSGAIGRVRIVLRLVPEADPAAVREILLARLAAHPELLGEPAPAVYLGDTRDGSLEYLAIAFVASARQAVRVKSELLFQIVPDLKARGVAFANPVGAAPTPATP